MTGPLHGLMMDFPLTLAPLLERAARIFGRVEIVSRRPDRSLARTTYADFHRRARRLASALTEAGLRRGDRVYAAICIAEIAVLVLAASGALTVGH